ncbi:hypothetical protein PULV_a2877 [Pseudoalteromonas ulvae UL12]|nr:hypothetical protein [Pseudoalteromonas ulvae UL12]
MRKIIGHLNLAIHLPSLTRFYLKHSTKKDQQIPVISMLLAD